MNSARIEIAAWVNHDNTSPIALVAREAALAESRNTLEGANALLRGLEEDRQRTEHAAAPQRERVADLRLRVQAAELAEGQHAARLEEAQADPEVTARFERLRELRLRLSKEANVPPYVVFHDKTLVAMAALRPKNESELMEIGGVGQSKLEKWGAAFLEALTEEVDPDQSP